MTPEEREEMNELCERMQTEKDPAVFAQLVRELNHLLEIMHERSTQSTRPCKPDTQFGSTRMGSLRTKTKVHPMQEAPLALIPAPRSFLREALRDPAPEPDKPGDQYPEEHGVWRKEVGDGNDEAHRAQVRLANTINRPAIMRRRMPSCIAVIYCLRSGAAAGASSAPPPRIVSASAASRSISARIAARDSGAAGAAAVPVIAFALHASTATPSASR
jgi:hypothetical protein